MAVMMPILFLSQVFQIELYSSNLEQLTYLQRDNCYAPWDRWQHMRIPSPLLPSSTPQIRQAPQNALQEDGSLKDASIGRK